MSTNGAKLSPQISVIIPTWNEARWLPDLLADLDRLPNIVEVIVADNQSTDSTADLARAAGCTVVAGGKPARAKNNGGEVAKGNLIVFVDADVRLTPEVFDAVLDALADPMCNLAHFALRPIAATQFVEICYDVNNWYSRQCHRFGVAQGAAPLIGVRRDAFFAVGGFDETVAVAEETHFIRSVSRAVGGVRLIHYPPLPVSARRFEMESPVAYAAKCVGWGFLRFVGLRISVMDYRWQSYPSYIQPTRLTDRP